MTKSQGAWGIFQAGYPIGLKDEAEGPLESLDYLYDFLMCKEGKVAEYNYGYWCDLLHWCLYWGHVTQKINGLLAKIGSVWFSEWKKCVSLIKKADFKWWHDSTSVVVFKFFCLAVYYADKMSVGVLFCEFWNKTWLFYKKHADRKS